jgi:type III pantothenate kinase
MILLLDIGNTHTHLGLATGRRVVRHADVGTAQWSGGRAPRGLARFLTGAGSLDGACLCSVVPGVTPHVLRYLRRTLKIPTLVLDHKTVRGIGVDYPRPGSIGPDRLANAVAARHHHGAPSVVVDFGTAVTFDVVNRQGCYEGGIIAPGLAAMTGYLHEKTALLPSITLRDTEAVVGRSTREAMLIGAVHGYRGLIKELIRRLKRELKCPRLPVVATGGCAHLIARRLKEITAVDPLLTLEGLRLVWEAGPDRS